MKAPMATFRLDAPLRRGITLIEASAGTGKTYSIASLFVRLVAEEGIPVDRILVVTFTEAATLELRTRLRGRLEEAVALVRGERSGDDPGLASLLAGDASARDGRIRRLEAALSGFDRAFVSTIHGFCQRMLALHAFEARVDLDRELVADLEPMLEELVADYLARLLHGADPLVAQVLVAADMTHASLRQLAREVTGDLGARLVPDDDASFDEGLAAFTAALGRFCALFRAGGRESVCAALDAAIAATPRRLDGRRYKAGSPAKQCERMEAFLERPSLGDAAEEGGLAAYFSAEQVRASTKAGDPLVHPVLEAWDEVRAAAAALHASLHVPRRRFADWVREELGRRLDAAGLVGFDGLVRALARGVAHPSDGPALAAAIRRRFDAALLDEFQDTDAEQWAIFSSVFDDPERYLYLIGDPKQAIYGFRGADVHVYARAARLAGEDRRFTMDVNHRSDARYVDAMNAVFGAREALFDLDFVGYVPVRAAPRNAQDGVRFPDGRAPLRFRYFDGTSLGSGGKAIGKAQAEDLVPRLVADDVLEALERGRILEGEGDRAVLPRDIAVLVRTNRQALAMRAALAARAIPAVIGNSGSVYETEEALLVDRCLAALLDPGREGKAKALALTPIGGFTAEELDRALRHEPDRWARFVEDLFFARRALEQWGVKRALDFVFDRRGVVERISAEDGGERRLVNLRHLEELLHRAESEERLGPEALLAHLRARREGDVEGEDVEALRLESDADTVRVVTLHKSKGLEYPIVFASHLWDGSLLRGKGDGVLRFHDDEDRIVLDLSAADDPRRPAHRAIAEREVMQESLRLAYVAFTRARHMAIVYFGPVRGGSGDASREGYESSALACLVHGHAAPPQAAPLWAAVRARVGEALHKKTGGGVFEEVFEGDPQALAALARRGTGALVDVTRCRAAGSSRYAPEAREAPRLERRVFGRTSLDTPWGRHSYTTIVRHAEERAEADITEIGPGWDEATSATHARGGRGSAEPDAPLPLDGFPRGPAAGTFVHKVFERIDFADGRDLRTGRALGEVVREIGRASGMADEAPLATLESALPAVLRTPLGPAARDRPLSQIGPAERLNELAFDLPLGAVAASEIVAAMRRRAPDARIGASYLEALDALRSAPLAGFLTGTIDLVFRIPCEDGRPRYFVADYKTNHLDAVEDASRASAYDLAGMRRAMEEHHYYLQYHLYLVALHRFLQHRLGAAYDYERDVGGALYLFVRGMLGPDTVREGDVVRGVFHDKPPREVIDALSRLFGRQGASS